MEVPAEEVSTRSNGVTQQNLLKPNLTETEAEADGTKGETVITDSSQAGVEEEAQDNAKKVSADHVEGHTPNPHDGAIKQETADGSQQADKVGQVASETLCSNQVDNQSTQGKPASSAEETKNGSLAEKIKDENTTMSIIKTRDKATSLSVETTRSDDGSAPSTCNKMTNPSENRTTDETKNPSPVEVKEENTGPLEILPSTKPVRAPPASFNSPEVSGDESISPVPSSNDHSAQDEIPAVTQAVKEVETERTEPQTSFVNEYALNNQESPTYNVDRNLEQFSEILLDSDPSDGEAQAVGETGVVATKSEKAKKRVRFADEVVDLHGSRHGQSPPPPPSSLPTHPSPEPSSKHPGVPITPSPTSPKNNKTLCPQFTVDELINGVELPAEYLGSTPIILDGLGAMKTARMFQAQQAVQLIKDPESESRPRFAVKLKISTGSIKIADSQTDVDMMEHPLHTITYVADIDHVLVIMAHIRPPSLPNAAPRSPNTSPRSAHRVSNGAAEEEVKYIPKMTCHVLDSPNAREAAMVIGQAFSAAYKQFLRSSGISERQLEQAEYSHILNAQSVPKLEVESLGDRNKIKKLTLAKHKNDIMGMMVMESGYGSAIPSCVIVHLSKTGSASKCGLLNIGDHIISINGVNLVGMPKKACIEQIKKCRYINVVKMEVCSCPTVVDVTIVRPDLKYQLGFSVHEGSICSLVRGSIAERSGVRIGHRIIDINGTSTVGMQHSDVVHLLSSTVGDLHIRMMPEVLYKLLTGKLQPEYY